MSGATSRPQQAHWTWKPRTQTGALGRGAAAGLSCGTLGLGASMAFSRLSIREVPITAYLVILPALGAITGLAYFWRGHFEQVQADEALRRARPRRLITIGFRIGCGAAALATVLDLSWRGWLVLGGPALLNVLLIPFLCALLAFSLSRGPGEGLSLRNLRLSVGGLMTLIAYLAVVLGVAVEGQRIGNAARRYRAQRIGAQSQAVYYRMLAARRPNHIARLRAGTVPDRSADDQKTYMERLAAYYERCALKYARAERRPWKPLEPDPPPP